jgi:CubicO group peptidase (beta-lactamase class C family)
MTASSVFNVGSVTKPVTASLIYRLVEDGKISLDDPVDRYVDELAAPNVPLIHLITHTSGLTWDIPAAYPESREDLPRFRNQLFQGRSQATPGSQFSYSCSGYALLLLVVERVSGMPVEEFAQRILFGPLGMTATHFDVSRVDPTSILLPWDGKALSVASLHAPPMGASGLLSHSRDLIRCGDLFIRQPKDNTPLSAKTCALMLTECTGGKFLRASAFFLCGPQKGRNPCFGQKCSPEAVAHPGFSGCCLMIDPPRRLSVAIVTNSTAFHGDWSNYGRIFDFFV